MATLHPQAMYSQRQRPTTNTCLICAKIAYIDARYLMSYRIMAEELVELHKRVLVLAELVRAACLEWSATFCGVEVMRKDLPLPPMLGEPLLQDVPTTQPTLKSLASGHRVCPK